MIAERIPALADLSKEEKVLLAAELWAEAKGIDETPEPDPATLKLLSERLDQFESNAESALSWEAFRNELKAIPNG